MSFTNNVRETPKIVFVGFVICALAFILNLVAFASPGWLPVGIITYGLWQGCKTETIYTESDCMSIFDTPFLDIFEWFWAVQCMAVLSLLSLMAGLSCMVVFCLRADPKPRTIYIAGLICFICAESAGVIEMAVLTGKADGAVFGVMYDLAWAAVGILLPGVIVFGAGMNSLQR